MQVPLATSHTYRIRIRHRQDTVKTNIVLVIIYDGNWVNEWVMLSIDWIIKYIQEKERNTIFTMSFRNIGVGVWVRSK